MNGYPALRVEWAVEGKQPGSSDEYDLIACSRGPLDRAGFSQIRNKFVTGTPNELPQITVGAVGAGDDARLLVIIRRWSGDTDRRGRPIAATRYFSVPYHQLADHRVSYEALYLALDQCEPRFDPDRPENGDLIDISVPVLDPAALAARADLTAMSAAALLLSDQQVCIVGADFLAARERLRHLDVVTALLPYGMRARLTASTWTRAADHSIKLSFSTRALAAAHQVSWGEAAKIPRACREALSYHQYLSDNTDRLPELIAWLADDYEQRGFGARGRSGALARLAEFKVVPGTYRPPILADRSSVERALQECADYLESGDFARLADTVSFLQEVLGKRAGLFDPGEQASFQEIVRARRLVFQLSRADGRLDEPRRVILAIAYGPALSAAGLQHIIRQLEVLPPRLLTTLLGMSPGDAAVSLYLATRLGGAVLSPELDKPTTPELVMAAAQEPIDIQVLAVVQEELLRRGASYSDTDMASALRQVGHLAGPIAAAYPNQPETQQARIRQLLRAAYGPALGIREFLEIVRFPPKRGEGPLFAAALDLIGPDSAEAVRAAVIKYLREERLAEPDVDRLEAAMRTPKSLPMAPASPPIRQGPVATFGKAPGGRHADGRPLDAVLDLQRERRLNGVHESGARHWSRTIGRFVPREASSWIVLILVALVFVAVTIVAAIVIGVMNDTGTGTPPEPSASVAPSQTYIQPWPSPPSATPDNTPPPEKPSEEETRGEEGDTRLSQETSLAGAVKVLHTFGPLPSQPRFIQ